MQRILLILKAIATYRSLLFPALMGFVGAVVHLLGWHFDVGKIRDLLDATFGLLTAVSVVVGAVMDVNNAKVKQALTIQADAINHNADLQDPSTDTNPLQVPPAYVPSPPKVDPPTTQEKP